MTVSAPFFTVAIPVYNGSAFVRKAADSVLAQTFADWELIIIDNQSTDGTWELLQSLYSAHPKVTLLRNDTNIGAGNFTRCTLEARGEWVAILAADDFYVVHALETAHREISRRPGLVLWAHSEMVFAPSFVRLCAPYTDVTVLPARRAAALLYRKGNIFGPLSNYLFLRSAAISRRVNFAEGTATVDYRFWIRLLMANQDGTFFYWPEPLSRILIHDAAGGALLGRENRIVDDFFDTIRALSPLGWDRATLLYQMARVVKCWFRFRRQLPPAARFLPLAVLGTLARQLMSAGNSDRGGAGP